MLPNIKPVSQINQKIITCLFIVLLASSTACQDNQQEKEGKKVYYDLKGFIENQIVYLNEKHPAVAKTTELDGKTELAKTKDVNWKKELELFVQADINKPAYRQSYKIIHKDSLSYEYSLKPSADLPVRYLKIVTDTLSGQPVYVQAILRSQNKIYKSEKTIELSCAKRNKLLELNSYKVQGYQKLIFMDRKSFKVLSKIGL